MPHTSRRPRASAGRRGRPAPGGSPRGGSAQGRSAQSRSAQGRPAQRRPAAAPRDALDLALDAAAATPPPEATSFGELGLDPRLVSALAAGDIHEPFAIQARALPDALAGRNLLGRAQTGSGKTLAFGLPLLNRLAATAPASLRLPGTPRGLILVPTRELAQQVADVLTPLARRVRLGIATVYGGVPIGRQIDRVRDADVVVATPGRLIDLMERGACALDGIEITVLDEADHMADLGFMPAVTRILDATPSVGQRMFFSATLDRAVGQLVTAYVTDPALHAVAPPADATPAEHQVLVLDAQDKLPVAAEIAGRPGRTLFFVRTKHGADRLAKQLSRAGIDAAAIHGDRNQNQRQRALDGFTAGSPRVLVATNVAARGIHVDDVDLVVQFDPPNDPKDYLHRSGRTARAGATGMVVALVDPAQLRDLEKLHEAAGVTAVRHEVAAGHHVVREIAASGTPIAAPDPSVAGHPGRPEARRQDARPDRGGRPARDGRGSRSGRGGRSGRGARDGGDGREQAQDRSRPDERRGQEPSRTQARSRAQDPRRGRDRSQAGERSQRAGQSPRAGASGRADRPGRPPRARQANWAA
jgi:superfamily II DNA/RNA helicase